MKQFVAWARVSSQHQKREGFSLEEQEARLNEFADHLGGRVVRLFKVAETASKPQQRFEFEELKKYVRRNSKKLSGILFVKVDRATRNIGDWAELEAIERECHVPLKFPDQPAGDTPQGRFQRRMTVNMAAFQVEQQAIDIRAGHRRRVVEGGLPNGSAAYGYRFHRINGRSLMEVDPISGPKVQRIFWLYAHEPLTIDTLIIRLGDEGIRYSDKMRLFPRTVVHRILTNQTYLGRVPYQGAWYPGKFVPLVDGGVFTLVQDRLGGKVYQQHELTYAGGLFKCGVCGHVVTGERKRKKSPLTGKVREYTYYRCSKYNRPDHPRDRVTEETLNDQILDLFRRLRLDDETRAWFADVIRVRAQGASAHREQQRTELHRQNIDAEKRQNRLLDLRLNDEITQEQFAAKQKVLQEERDAVLTRLESLNLAADESVKLAITAFELSQSLTEKWVAADYRAKRTILGIIIREGRLNSGKLEFSTKKPFDLLIEGFALKGNGAMGVQN